MRNKGEFFCKSILRKCKMQFKEANRTKSKHSFPCQWPLYLLLPARGVVARKILKGQPFSNNYVIKYVTSLLQLALQNIGGEGGAATVATPATTPLI